MVPSYFATRKQRSTPVVVAIALVVVLSIGYGCALVWVPRTWSLAATVGIVGSVVLAPVALRLARKQHLLISLLALSFVLTGLRRDIGFITLEPWQIVIVFCFTSWALETVRHRRSPLTLDKVGLLGLLVVVGALLSFFGALDVMTWLKRAVRFVLLFGLYLYLVSHVRSQSQLAALIRSSLVACALTSLVLFVQFFQTLYYEGAFFAWSDWNLRGTFANLNEGATYLAMFVVLAAAVYSQGVHHELMGRRVFMIAAGLSALGLVLYRSRTGLPVTVAVGILLFAGNKRIRRLLLIASLVLALTWNLPFARFLRGRLLASFNASGNPEYDAWVQRGILERMYLFRIYWETIKAHPVFGIGAANYGLIRKLNLNVPPPPAGIVSGNLVDYLGTSAHNGYLSWWAETGTVGFVPFVGSLGYAIWALWRLQQRCLASPWWRAVLLGTLGALLVFVLTNVTGDFGASEVRYWLLLALASIVLQQLKESERPCTELPTSRIPGIPAAPTTA